MESVELDEVELFEALEKSGARVLLIGRKAIAALGLPIMTADYDLWIHIDDIEILNQAIEPLGHIPNRTPDEARKRGRYVLENGDHIDVMVARAQTTKDGEVVRFDDVWERRQRIPYGNTGLFVTLPTIADLIRTKRWAMRPKDLIDIDALETLDGELSSKR